MLGLEAKSISDEILDKVARADDNGVNLQELVRTIHERYGYSDKGLVEIHHAIVLALKSGKVHLTQNRLTKKNPFANA